MGYLATFWQLGTQCAVIVGQVVSGLDCTGVSFSFKRKQRSAVRGAKNGKLLPGEKKRMKREKMQAKRASRSAVQGLDLEAINAELIHFVTSHGDMKVSLEYVSPLAGYWALTVR